MSGIRAVMARSDGFSTARAARAAALVLLAGGVVLLLAGRVASALSLTASGGVAIINLRWLDAVVERLIQPGRPRLDGGTVVKLALRMGLLGSVVLAIVAVRRVDPAAVAAGFTVPVATLLIEGVRSAREGEG